MTPEGSASVIGQASLGGETPGLSFALSLTQDAGGGRARALAAVRRGEDARLVRHQRQVGHARSRDADRSRFRPTTSARGLAARCFRAPRWSAPCRSRTASFRRSELFRSIKNAVGGITFGNATASIWAQTGVVEVPGRGELQAGGTTLIIPELGRMRAARRPASGACRVGRGARRRVEHAAARDRCEERHPAGELSRAKRRSRSTRTSRSTRAASPT